MTFYYTHKARLLITSFLCCLWIGITGCEGNDLGKSCPDKSVPGNTTPPVTYNGTDSTQGAKSVSTTLSLRRDEQCETFICLTSLVKADYCSRECSIDADCGGGFACLQIHPVGPLKDHKYCVLQRHCQTDRDCPRGNFFCQEFETSVTGQTERYCNIRNK